MNQSREESSRKAFVGMALLILAGLIFALGVMVGRNLALENAPQPKDSLQKIDERDQGKLSAKSQELSFHELLNRAVPPKEFQPNLEKKPKETPKPVNPVSPKKTSRDIPPLVEQPEQNSTPQPVYSEQADSIHVYLQLASFREREQAEQFSARLLKNGFPKTSIVQGEVEGKGTYFRVRLGPILDSISLEILRKKIRQAENIDAIVVKAD